MTILHNSYVDKMKRCEIMKLFIKIIFVLSVISFLFQYLWEYFQCGIFYIMPVETASSLMISAVIGDVFITLTLYLILAFMNKRFDWIIAKWQSKELIVMILYSLFVSFYFESSALYTGRWTYSNEMPLFPNTGIGLLPVLQLLILIPLTCYISKKIIKFLH